MAEGSLGALEMNREARATREASRHSGRCQRLAIMFSSFHVHRMGSRGL